MKRGYQTRDDCLWLAGTRPGMLTPERHREQCRVRAQSSDDNGRHMIIFLKTLAPALMALGSIIIAIRAKRILDALVRAVAVTVPSECGVRVRDCPRIGIGLLVVGFLLIAAGALISGFMVGL